MARKYCLLQRTLVQQLRCNGVRSTVFPRIPPLMYRGAQRQLIKVMAVACAELETYRGLQAQ